MPKEPESAKSVEGRCPLLVRAPVVAVLSMACALTACDSVPSGTGQEPPTLHHFGSSEPVSYSSVASLALLPDSRACVVASYEVRVHCGEIEWNNPLILGGDGEGPGEFERAPLWVMRGSGGRVGTYDPGLRRLTVFGSDGDLLHTTSLPFLFSPVGPFDRTITGSFVVFGERPPGALMATVSLPDGEIVGTDTLPHPSELGLATEAEEGMAQPARGPDGEFVAGTGRREILRYDAGGELLDHFMAPTYREELPSARDVEAYREGMKESFGGAPSESAVQEYAQRPKSYRIPGRSIVFDPRGRYWIATQRDRDQHSWLDVYRGSELLGSVRVRDRILAFDILGTTLAVLVERSTRGEEGLRVRAIDWYRIGGEDSGS